MDLPFDGAISDFYNNGAPDAVRERVKAAKKKKILNPTYPYQDKMSKSDYEKQMAQLQIELVKLQSWVNETGHKIVIVFEGRDAAGKGGTIKRFRENMGSRSARTVALSKPTDEEAGQWYFQRYIERMPTEGEIIFFDRSWYNRGVVEKVFGFCEDEERELFFKQVTPLEKMVVESGTQLIKFWLNVGQAEQLRRIHAREQDPLKQWKLSWIDVEGLKKWDAYSDAIEETLKRSHTDETPWTVVRSDDKKRARIAAIQTLLSQVDYDKKNTDVVTGPDRKICGGPDMWADSADA